MNRSPIIVALDLESADQARALVHKLGSQADFYKVGMELYAAAGMEFVRELTGAGKRVFLDLKLYDIGETVRRTVAQVVKAEVEFLTLHSSGAVLRAAVEGRGAAKLRLLAVTVLTSFNQDDVRELGYECALGDLVAHFAQVAAQTGVDGMICSALDLPQVRAIAGPSAILVCPGVRSSGAAHGDQKRVATPAEALANGADYLVIGRPLTRASDPAAALAQILGEISSAQAGRAGNSQH